MKTFLLEEYAIKKKGVQKVIVIGKDTKNKDNSLYYTLVQNYIIRNRLLVLWQTLIKKDSISRIPSFLPLEFLGENPNGNKRKLFLSRFSIIALFLNLLIPRVVVQDEA